MISRELKRLFIAPVTWCCILIFTGIILLGMAEDLHTSGVSGWLEQLWVSENFGIGCLLSTLVFPLPFAISAYDEKQSRYDWLLLMRCGYRQYAICKILSCLIGTVLMYVLSMLLAAGLGSLISPGRLANCTADQLDAYFGQGPWGMFARHIGYLPALLIYLVGNSLSLAPFSAIAVIVSVYAGNRYVVCAIPFLLYRLGSYFGGYLDKMNYSLFEGVFFADGGLSRCLLMNACVLGFLGILYYSLLKWRTLHG